MTDYIRDFVKRINQNRRDFIWNWAVSAVLFLIAISFGKANVILENTPGMWYVLPNIFCMMFSVSLCIPVLLFLVLGLVTLVKGGESWND